MWKGRKSAFAAMGRISPNYIVQDGVIPRSEIGRVLREIAELSPSAACASQTSFTPATETCIRSSSTMRRIAGQEHHAEAVGGEILRICLRYGGSITGEHGVGADKAVYLGEQFGDDDLDAMNAVRCAFDPERIFNPGKVFPTPRLCGDRPGPYRAHGTEITGEAERG